jgi:hypothetical protein
MGPPAPAAAAVAPMPRLGSLLVAAQMASAAAGSCMGLSGMNSPLLLATQATLQATTASVVAAEVLAAASAPGGMQGISSACVGQGMPHALAGLLSSSIHTALAPAAVALPAPQLQPQISAPTVLLPGLPLHADAAVLHPQAIGAAAARTGAGGDPAVAGEDSSGCVLHTQQQADAAPVLPVHDPGCEQQEAMGTQQPVDAAAGTGADTAAAAASAAVLSAGAAAAPAAVQLPSWLCEPSAELRASQAICKASLFTATAALARLSSPKGLSLAAAGPPRAAGRSTAAAAGGLSVSPLGGSAWGPNSVFSPTLPAAAGGALVGEVRPRPSPGLTLCNSPAAPPASRTVAAVPHTGAVHSPQVVFGIPAVEVSAGGGTVWGLPVDAAAAAAAAAAATANAGYMRMPLPAVRTFRPPVDLCELTAATAAVSEDAGSCSSSPRAMAAAAARTVPAALAAAAAKLTAAVTDVHAAGPKRATQQQQQQQYSGASQPGAGSSVGGSSVGGSSIALTADDASSPETSDDALSADPDSAAAEVDAAAVVVHVAVTRRKGTPVAPAAPTAAAAVLPAKLQQQ